jgi:hypothetical protein
MLQGSLFVLVLMVLIKIQTITYENEERCCHYSPCKTNYELLCNVDTLMGLCIVIA